MNTRAFVVIVLILVAPWAAAEDFRGINQTAKTNVSNRALDTSSVVMRAITRYAHRRARKSYHYAGFRQGRGVYRDRANWGKYVRGIRAKVDDNRLISTSIKFVVPFE